MKSRLYGPGLHQSFPVCSTPGASAHVAIQHSDPAWREASSKARIWSLFDPYVILDMVRFAW